jgi:hypothetical protein
MLDEVFIRIMWTLWIYRDRRRVPGCGNGGESMVADDREDDVVAMIPVTRGGFRWKSKRKDAMETRG